MRLTLLLLTLLVPLLTHAKSQPNVMHAEATDSIAAQAPNLSAKAYLLYDNTTKQILLEQNSNQRIEPASLTKLMTAYIAFSALQHHKLALTESVTPSIQATRAQPEDSRMYLRHGKPVLVSELLNGLIVASANDAARVLAETIAGNEAAFADLMNKEALRLGMQDTHFVNSTGLPDPLHYSSANDLMLLTTAIIKDFPEHFPLYGKREFSYNGIKHYNRNRLLWMDPHVDGMKTGHTESAGYCLIATANRNDHRLITVVLGNASDNLRSAESQRLLNYGFQNFELLNIYKPNQTISNIRLWKGTDNTVKAGLREGLTITLPKGKKSQLKATIETQQPMIAPIGDGQQIGILKLSLAGEPYLEFPLVALKPVALVNIFSRGIDSIRMLFIK